MEDFNEKQLFNYQKNTALIIVATLFDVQQYCIHGCFVFNNLKHMKQNLLKATIAISLSFVLFACKKKESGVCYCHYLSGDKKEYDLSDLRRSEQIDSCYVLDSYAEAFAGDCDLK